MNGILKKILKTFVDVLTVSVFLVLVLIIVAKVKMMFSGKDYFELFGYSVFTVATGSMEPAISQNDVIIVKKEKEYEVNDIATFVSDKAFITHRIISISGHEFVTKGDANNAKDAIIKDTDIIGKVVHIFRNGAVWQKVLTSPLTIAMIFMTLILFDFAFSYKGNKKKLAVQTTNQVQVPLENVLEKQTIPNEKQETQEIIKQEVQNEPAKLVEKVEEIEQNDPNFNPDYTVRLDLDELMKQIDNHLNGDDDV